MIYRIDVLPGVPQKPGVGAISDRDDGSNITICCETMMNRRQRRLPQLGFCASDALLGVLRVLGGSICYTSWLAASHSSRRSRSA
jgi:hypothetical protein